MHGGPKKIPQRVRVFYKGAQKKPQNFGCFFSETLKFLGFFWGGQIVQTHFFLILFFKGPEKIRKNLVNIIQPTKVPTKDHPLKEGYNRRKLLRSISSDCSGIFGFVFRLPFKKLTKQMSLNDLVQEKTPQFPSFFWGPHSNLGFFGANLYLYFFFRWTLARLNKNVEDSRGNSLSGIDGRNCPPPTLSWLV